MSVTSPDFESGAYTNFATPADMIGKVGHAILGADLPIVNRRTPIFRPASRLSDAQEAVKSGLRAL